MEKRIFHEDEKGQIICHNCERLVDTTYRYRDYSIGEGVIPHLLVGVCDVCDSIVSIPASSIPQFLEGRKTLAGK